MSDLLRSAILLLVILNPFALSVYLIELLHDHNTTTVAKVLARAGLISGLVFGLFAWAGERIFTDFLQVRFAAFQVFGGLVFLLIALRYMVAGGGTLVVLRGEPAHLAGAIAMPFMIGPGTVSAAAVAGIKLSTGRALAAIGLALVVTVLTILVLKVLFDRVRQKNQALVERYTELASRVSAIVVGTIAVEMLFSGLESWVKMGAQGS